MSTKPYKGFEPKWVKEAAPKDSYRSIFRWGDPDFVKYPKESLYKMMKETFKMTDDDFKSYCGDIGMGKVELNIPSKLDEKHIKALKEIFGDEFVSTADYDRLSVAYGQTAYDLMRMRQHRYDSLPDAVVYPDTAEQIEKCVAYCVENKIPLYVYGGGSSVTRGVEPIKGGISMDMRKRYNKVISFNEVDQTITVQTGMSGPCLEKTLNEAVKNFGAKRAYTCGHFPQSFEYSSVGGWVVTRGAGQNSTYYGCIADIVLSQKYATPVGKIVTSHYPPRGDRPEPQPDNDGLGGHLRRADRGHPQSIPLHAREQKALLLHIQGLADRNGRRPRNDAVRMRLFLGIPSLRPRGDQPYAPTL